MELLSKIVEKSAINAEIILISAIFFSFAWHFIFSKHKYIAASMMLGLGFFSLGYFGGILAWIYGLGGDSFLEVTSFDVREAFFWISTFLSSSSQMLIPLSKTTIMIAGEVISLSVILYLLTCWRPVLMRILVCALITGIVYFVYFGYTGFKSGRSYVNTLQKQFDSNPRGFKTSEDIDLFVYIGESTSNLNMSLYAYPLTTTPRLNRLYRNDTGFLRFDRVRSTHTHTSPSLLRAFAVTSPQQDGHLIQWGIGNVLRQSGLSPRLHSVQPLNGSFATFSRFVFDGFDLNLPSADRYKGNFALPRIKDHQLLDKALEGDGVVFFHSYAGHGPYLEFVDFEIATPVSKPTIRFDGTYGSIFSEMLNANLSKNVANYDIAITYIDRNVAHAIENIKHRSKPAVLIYFSDHGEAVYAGGGHESSNFIDEMSTVPMVLYFNEAYRVKYPDIFSKYQKASYATHTKLLDQVSSTILDILFIGSNLPLDVPTMASSSIHPRPFILERDTISGISRINLKYDLINGFSKEQFFGGNPESTYISIINDNFGSKNAICYHRSNSFAKALRAAAVANCLEFDLVVDGDDLNVYHPPESATGFKIEQIFSIAQARKNNLWIDSKNLSDPMACNKLASYLENNHTRVGQILVEFPWETSDVLPDLQSCGRRLRSIGAITSYYVPTHLIVPCAEDKNKYASECIELDHNVQKIIASGIFSDLSFDFLGYPAMKRIKGSKKLKWNTWAIKAADFHIFPRQDFNFIIMNSEKDPNTY